MKSIKILGDVHGKFLHYLRFVDNCEYSVQIGDFGFGYSILNGINSDKHKLFFGNHDNQNCFDIPHNLGHYGTYTLNGVVFFFIRGAFSIDYKYRQNHELQTGQKIWWENEELSYKQMQDCLVLYTETKPDIVLSHSYPTSVARDIGNPNVLRSFGFNPLTFKTNTQTLLQCCLEEWQPKTWIFGHFHRYYNKYFGRTNFTCLPELGYGDLYENGNFIYQ